MEIASKQRTILFWGALVWFLAGLVVLAFVLWIRFGQMPETDRFKVLMEAQDQQFLSLAQEHMPQLHDSYLARALVRLNRMDLAPHKVQAAALLDSLPRSSLDTDALFLLVAHGYRRAGLPEQLIRLYDESGRPRDSLYVEASLRSGASPDLSVLLTEPRPLRLTDWYLALAAEFNEPAYKAWAAAVSAASGNMERAASLWPVESRWSEWNPGLLDGSLRLSSSLMADLSPRQLALIGTYPNNPYRQFALVEHDFRKKRGTDGWKTLASLMLHLPDSDASSRLAASILHMARTMAVKTDEERDYRSRVFSALETWYRRHPFPIPLGRLGHDESVSALWNHFLDNPSNADVWRQLAWFLAISHDDKGLSSILEKYQGNRQSWYAFFEAWHAILSRRPEDALRLFEEAGGWGIAEAWHNAAILHEVSGNAPAAARSRDRGARMAQYFFQ